MNWHVLTDAIVSTVVTICKVGFWILVLGLFVAIERGIVRAADAIQSLADAAREIAGEQKEARRSRHR